MNDEPARENVHIKLQPSTVNYIQLNLCVLQGKYYAYINKDFKTHNWSFASVTADKWNNYVQHIKMTEEDVKTDKFQEGNKPIIIWTYDSFSQSETWSSKVDMDNTESHPWGTNWMNTKAMLPEEVCRLHY
jgi:hypothetical protein